MKLTTTNLRLPSARAWWNLPVPVAAAICVFALLAIAGLVGQLRAAGHIAPAPTPALDPIIIIASPLPQGIPPTAVPAAQVAAVLPNTLRGAVVAYDAPAGNVLGAIEAGRTYALLARYGAEWLQADVAGSGVVWLKADQVLDLPPGLADLEPTPAPVVVERPIYVSAPPAAAEAAPTVSEPSAPPPTMAPQTAAILDRSAWAAAAATAQARR